MNMHIYTCTHTHAHIHMHTYTCSYIIYPYTCMPFLRRRIDLYNIGYLEIYSYSVKTLKSNLNSWGLECIACMSQDTVQKLWHTQSSIYRKTQHFSTLHKTHIHLCNLWRRREREIIEIIFLPLPPTLSLPIPPPHAYPIFHSLPTSSLQAYSLRYFSLLSSSPCSYTPLPVSFAAPWKWQRWHGQQRQRQQHQQQPTMILM